MIETDKTLEELYQCGCEDDCGRTLSEELLFKNKGSPISERVEVIFFLSENCESLELSSKTVQYFEYV